MTDTPESRYERGARTLGKIHRKPGQNVLAALEEIAPDFARMVIEFPFGDIYSRPGLGLRDRQMITIAALATLGHAELELTAHIDAGLNAGLMREEIIELLMQIAVYAGFPAALNGLLVAKQVFATRDAEGADGAEV
jgi:4-carboxymuconolactone decarboxylase